MRHESCSSSTSSSHSWSGLFQEANEPRHFAHHTILRGADPRLFEALHRDLRLRLFDGRAVTRCGVRMASMRQGLPPHLGSFLCGLGWFGLAFGLLVGSDLGRAARQHSGDGGAAQAAVPTSTLVMFSQPSVPVVAVALGLLAAGLLIAYLSRKHVWLVAQPTTTTGIDLWIAATSWRHESRFEREFAAFVERARKLDLEFKNLSAEPEAQPAEVESAAPCPQPARLAS